jgi:hypothetical protein
MLHVAGRAYLSIDRRMHQYHLTPAGLQRIFFGRDLFATQSLLRSAMTSLRIPALACRLYFACSFVSHEEVSIIRSHLGVLVPIGRNSFGISSIVVCCRRSNGDVDTKKTNAAASVNSPRGV